LSVIFSENRLPLFGIMLYRRFNYEPNPMPKYRDLAMD
jgi:hypothetical protein